MTITAEAARKLALQQAEKEVAKVYTYIKEAAAKGHGGIRLGGPFWTGGDSNPPEVLWLSLIHISEPTRPY